VKRAAAKKWVAGPNYKRVADLSAEVEADGAALMALALRNPESERLLRRAASYCTSIAGVLRLCNAELVGPLSFTVCEGLFMAECFWRRGDGPELALHHLAERVSRWRESRPTSLCGPGAGRGGSHAKGPCRRLRVMPRPASSSAGTNAGAQPDPKGETA
jgi:hypothetical protein